jgi:hypothetical protein
MLRCLQDIKQAESKKMQDTKLKVKLRSSAHKIKSLNTTLPGNGARKVLDNPQV